MSLYPEIGAGMTLTPELKVLAGYADHRAELEALRARAEAAEENAESWEHVARAYADSLRVAGEVAAAKEAAK